MKALILGSQVCEVSNNQFPVAKPLLWVNCGDDAKPGTHYFDGENVVPVPPMALDKLKAQAHFRINVARESALNDGVVYGLNVFDSNQRSRENLTGTVSAVNAGIPLPLVFTWRTKDNQDVPMTAADLVGLAAAMLQHVNGVYQKSWGLKAQIDAATSAEEVSAITWS